MFYILIYVLIKIKLFFVFFLFFFQLNHYVTLIFECKKSSLFLIKIDKKKPVSLQVLKFRKYHLRLIIPVGNSTLIIVRLIILRVVRLFEDFILFPSLFISSIYSLIIFDL